jgi:hypothetical protein
MAVRPDDLVSDAATLKTTLFTAGLVSGSSLRTSTPTVPNGTTLPSHHGEVNLSVVQKLKLGPGFGTDLRWMG